jgi:hypothetical protein
MIKNFIAASLVEAPHNDLLQSYGDEWSVRWLHNE